MQPHTGSFFVLDPVVANPVTAEDDQLVVGAVSTDCHPRDICCLLFSLSSKGKERDFAKRWDTPALPCLELLPTAMQPRSSETFANIRKIQIDLGLNRWLAKDASASLHLISAIHISRLPVIPDDESRRIRRKTPLRTFP